MTHKIPAILVDTDGRRVESHELMTAGPGMTADDIKAARQFLERRAKLLGMQLADQWHMGNGEIRVWAKRDPHQSAEADAFTLMPQSGPAAIDTTADLFGYDYDDLEHWHNERTASRCASHRAHQSTPDLFAGA